MQRHDADLEGLWRSFYRYPSSGRNNDAMWGRHTLQATRTGSRLHFESIPGSKSHVIIEVTLDADGTAGGTWREETDADGYYQGVVYEGTVKFHLAADGKRLNGIWHGAGKDGDMNSDIWELTRDGVERSN